MFAYAGRLIGRELKFIRTTNFDNPNNISDPTRRRAIGGLQGRLARRRPLRVPAPSSQDSARPEIG